MVHTRMRAHQALRCDSVNTVVEAAAFGVTGTVIVGVAGFGASIWNTRKTLAATHKNWIRDQRAIAYLDAIAAVHYRQFSRQVAAGFGPLTEDRRREPLAAYRRPDWNVSPTARVRLPACNYCYAGSLARPPASRPSIRGMEGSVWDR